MKKTLIILSIVLLGLILRLYHLDGQSFFVDEAVQYSIASKPFSHIASMNYEGEVIPPLTFAILHFWLMINNSDFFARLLFVLIGMASLWVIYLLGRDLINERAGALAAFLMAINPFHIWYSQDARPYIFLMFFCAGHVWFFLRCINRGGWKNWLGFGIFASAALCSHPSAMFTLGLEFCYAVLTVRSSRFWSAYVLTGGVVIASFLPYAYTKMMRTFELPLGYHKAISWLVMPFAGYSWLFGFSVGPSLRELHLHLSARDYLSYVSWMLPTLFAFCIVVWSYIKNTYKNEAWRTRGILGNRSISTLLLCVWMCVPIFAVFLLSISPRSSLTFNVRYCSEAFIPFVLILASGIELLSSSRPWTITVLALFLVGSGISLGRLHNIDKYWKEDVRSAGHHLNSRAEATDLIIVPDYFAFQHYYKGSARVVPIAELFDARGILKMKPGQEKRVWLVYYREWALDPNGTVKSWLNAYMKQRGEYAFPNCTVFRYEGQNFADESRN